MRILRIHPWIENDRCVPMLLCTHLRKIVEKRDGSTRRNQFTHVSSARCLLCGMIRKIFHRIEEVLRLNEPLPFNVRWDFLLVSIYAGWSRGDFEMFLFTLARNLVRWLRKTNAVEKVVVVTSRITSLDACTAVTWERGVRWWHGWKNWSQICKGLHGDNEREAFFDDDDSGFSRVGQHDAPKLQPCFLLSLCLIGFFTVRLPLVRLAWAQERRGMSATEWCDRSRVLYNLEKSKAWSPISPLSIFSIWKKNRKRLFVTADWCFQQGEGKRQKPQPDRCQSEKGKLKSIRDFRLCLPTSFRAAWRR